MSILAGVSLVFPYYHYHYVRPYAGQVFFSKNASIAILDEKLIYMDDKFNVVYSISNTGVKPQKIKMNLPISFSLATPVNGELNLNGMPVGITEDEKIELEYIDDELDLLCTANGTVIQQKLQKLENPIMALGQGEDINYMYQGEIEFQPNETKTVIYNFSQEPMLTDYETGFYKVLLYLQLTETMWKKPIKSAYYKVVYPFFPLHEPFTNIVSYYRYSDLTGVPCINQYDYYITPKPHSISTSNQYFILEWNYKKYIPKNDIKLDWETSGEYQLADLTKAIEDEDFSKYMIIHGLFKEDFNDRDRFFSFIVTLGYALKEHDNINGAKNLMRFVINGMNALNGYKFIMKFWREFFSQFHWYKPKYDTVEFSGLDKIFVDTMLGATLTPAEKDKEDVLKKQAVKEVKDKLEKVWNK